MVSVIIVVFNAEKYLKYAIDSVFRQTYKDYEVIAVNDGSTDKTLEILKEYLRYPNFRIIDKQHNKNLGGNRNEAIKSAKGTFITFIDGDDIWEDDKLEMQLKYVSKYDLICTNAFTIDETNTVTSNRYIRKFSSTREVKLRDLVEENFIVVSSVMIKKSAVEESGYFEDGPDTRAEDYFLWLNYIKKNRILFLDENLLKYRLHSENWSNSKVIDWLRLLQRTVDIRSEYIDDPDDKVKLAASKGCVVSLLEMARVNRAQEDYCSAKQNLKKVIALYRPVISFKYLKYITGFFAMRLLCIIKK